MALNGDNTTAAAMRRSIRLAALDSEALSYVVLLDKVLGDDPKPAFDILERRMVSQDNMLHWKTTSSWDYDDISATAMGMRAMMAINPSDPRINTVLRWIMWRRQEQYWFSTRDTSIVLTALAEWLARHRCSPATKALFESA